MGEVGVGAKNLGIFAAITPAGNWSHARFHAAGRDAGNEPQDSELLACRYPHQRAERRGGVELIALRLELGHLCGYDLPTAGE
jgi:hypothetical protein